MLVLWTVRIDGGDGEEIYGKEYADIYAINRLHFKAASAYICDHVSLGNVVNFIPCGNTRSWKMRVRGEMENACQKRNGIICVEFGTLFVSKHLSTYLCLGVAIAQMF